MKDIKKITSELIKLNTMILSLLSDDNDNNDVKAEPNDVKAESNDVKAESSGRPDFFDRPHSPAKRMSKPYKAYLAGEEAGKEWWVKKMTVHLAKLRGEVDSGLLTDDYDADLNADLRQDIDWVIEDLRELGMNDKGKSLELEELSEKDKALAELRKKVFEISENLNPVDVTEIISRYGEDLEDIDPENYEDLILDLVDSGEEEPAKKSPPPPPPRKTAAKPKKKLILNDGGNIEEWYAEGWTDEEIIDAGHGEMS